MRRPIFGVVLSLAALLSLRGMAPSASAEDAPTAPAPATAPAATTYAYYVQTYARYRRGEAWTAATGLARTRVDRSPAPKEQDRYGCSNDVIAVIGDGEAEGTELAGLPAVS